MMNSTINSTGNGPSHILYNAEEGADKKTYWKRVGAAWPTKDGQGLVIRQNYIPVNSEGTLYLFPPKEKGDS